MAKAFIGWRSGLAAPSLVSPGTRYVALSQTISTIPIVNNGGGSVTYSSTGDTLPTGLSLDTSTGDITGTVDAGATVQTYDIEITATNATGSDAVQFVIDVRATYTEISSSDSFPYLLSSANRLYVLTEDVSTDAGAFIFAASGCVLDLDGNTLTFANATGLTVPNGGFESGSGSTVPNWDTTGAPDAAIAENDINAWGDQILSFDNITSANVIVSDQIAIPTANVEYAATVTPFGPQTSVVTLEIIDASTSSVLATGTSNASNHRGFAVVTYYTPTTTDPIKIRITVEPEAGQTQTIDLDYVSFTHSRIVGIMATSYRSDWPQYLKDDTTYWDNAGACRNTTVTNGTITQGASKSYLSQPYYIRGSLQGSKLTRCTISVNGIDSNIVEGEYAESNVVITDNVCTSTVDKVTNRFYEGAMFILFDVTGTVTFARNSISDHPKSGLEISGGSNHVIEDNTIDSNAIATNCYGITVSGCSNITIRRNTIATTRSGRGLFIGSGDGVASGIDGAEIHDNYVDVRERANMEFGYTGIEATALRMRSYTTRVDKNINVYNNTFIAWTDTGYARGAIAIRMTHANEDAVDGWNCQFYGNTLKAIVNTTSTVYYFARALTFEGVAAGVKHSFFNNTLESNDISLGFGGNDGFDARDITLTNNTIVKSTEGAVRSYQEVRVGQGNGTIDGIKMYSMNYAGGATDTITLTGTGNITISTGFRLTVDVDDSEGSPVSGATVSIKDTDLTEVYSSATGASGVIADIPVVATIIDRVGAGTPTTDDRNDITVDVTAAGYSAGQDVLTLTTDDSTTIALTSA